MKEVRSKEELLACEVGEHILHYGREVVYAGTEGVERGSRACGCATIISVPVVIYPIEDGKIARNEDPVFEHLSYSFVYEIEESDPSYQKYKELLGNLVI